VEDFTTHFVGMYSDTMMEYSDVTDGAVLSER